jgi:hypothetical protein
MIHNREQEFDSLFLDLGMNLLNYLKPGKHKYNTGLKPGKPNISLSLLLSPALVQNAAKRGIV